MLAGMVWFLFVVVLALCYAGVNVIRALNRANAYVNTLRRNSDALNEALTGQEARADAAAAAEAARARQLAASRDLVVKLEDANKQSREALAAKAAELSSALAANEDLRAQLGVARQADDFLRKALQAAADERQTAADLAAQLYGVYHGG